MASWKLHDEALIYEGRLSNIKKLSYRGACWFIKMVTILLSEPWFRNIWWSLSKYLLHWPLDISSQPTVLPTLFLAAPAMPDHCSPMKWFPEISILLILNHQMRINNPLFSKENIIHCILFWGFGTIPFYFKCHSSDSEF